MITPFATWWRYSRIRSIGLQYLFWNSVSPVKLRYFFWGDYLSHIKNNAFKGCNLGGRNFPKGNPSPKDFATHHKRLATQAPRHMLYQALDDLKLQEAMAATPPAAPTPAPKVAAKAAPKAQPKVAAKAPVLSRQVEHWHESFSAFFGW